MPGDGQLRYDAELNFRPHFWDYRKAPPPERRYRSLFYPNDGDTFDKALSGLGVGSIQGKYIAALITISLSLPQRW